MEYVKVQQLPSQPSGTHWKQTHWKLKQRDVTSDKGTRTRTGLKFPGSGPDRAGPGPDTGASPV